MNWAASCGDPIADEEVLWPDSEEAVNLGRNCSASVAAGLCGYLAPAVGSRLKSNGALIGGYESIECREAAYWESK